jgi:hypothetical protein
LIRKRHVFYVVGYDPQGAEGYYRLFRRELRRFLEVWPIKVGVSELVLDSEDVAHWTIESGGPNWQVTTRYEFLRLEQVIRPNMAQPLARQLWRAGRWIVDDLVTGTLFRIFRANWGFAVHLIYPQLMLILWLAVALAGGGTVALLATRFAGTPAWATIIVALAAAFGLFMALRPLASRWLVLQIANCWPYVREFSRGQPSAYNRPIDVYAQHIVTTASASDADEIVIIGHSAGGGVASAVVARALELDPELGRRGPRLVLMTVGSLLSALTLDPYSGRLRAAVERNVREPSLLWIDVQARKDWINFWNFDPLEGAGIDPGAKQCDLCLWHIRYRDMLTPESYGKLQWNLFRMHYQFIMANDNRAPYDYYMLVCGPAPIGDWADHGGDVLNAFSEQAAYDESQRVQSETDEGP